MVPQNGTVISSLQLLRADAVKFRTAIKKQVQD